jgi:DNA (cytosine-5)-methyltransferase 1
MTGTACERPVIVDMFCGAGGESQGIADAAKKADLQIEAYAINHWERAIETHRVNFPDSEHICRDVQDVDPSSLIPGRKVALLWASPACTHFSVARGGKPCDDQSRVTPFTVLDWLDKLTVDRLIIENVPEFQSWGPLDEDTHRPVQERKGETFTAFIAMIRAMGYTVDWNVMNAADFGAPTTRHRLFIQAVREASGKSILWPKPSHAQIGPNSTLTERLPAWVPARDIIDWNHPSESIYSRRRPLADRTMKRIREGLTRFGGAGFLVCMEHGGRVVSADIPLPTITTARGGAIGLAEPFLVEYYGNGSPRSVSDPLPTVTTHDRFGLVEPQQNGIDIRFRMLTPRELSSAQSFPSNYHFTGTRVEVVKQIGNAVCPKMAEALTTVYMQELAGSP